MASSRYGIAVAISLALALIGSTALPADADAKSRKRGVAATWQARQVYIPKNLTENGRPCSGITRSDTAKCLGRIAKGKRTPVVLFMHGCGGLSNMDQRVIDVLSLFGLPIVAPDSFARSNRRRNCRAGANKKGILRLRWAEVDYAIKKLSKQPWVDAKRIVLAGFSEGGVTTSLSRNKTPAARIILGWTCKSPQRWWRGLRASKTTPILAVVGTNDEYHRAKYHQGHCGEFFGGRQNSKSVVIKDGGHDVSLYPETEAAIRWFLGEIF